jgi:hypothetical protein
MQANAQVMWDFKTTLSFLLSYILVALFEKFFAVPFPLSQWKKVAVTKRKGKCGCGRDLRD